LVTLLHLFRPRPVVFLCSLRDDIGIIQGFYVAKTPGFPNKALSFNSNERIARFLARTQFNIERQQDELKKFGAPLEFIHFNEMKEGAAGVISNAIGGDSKKVDSNRKLIDEWAYANVGVKSVREGELWCKQQNIDPVTATDSQIEEILTHRDELLEMARTKGKMDMQNPDR
jgi:hypothetical protein